MTRLQLEYAQYIENRRHSMQAEAQAQAELEERRRSNRANESLEARDIANKERSTTISEQVSAATIKQAEASIRQADKTLELKENQQNWQQQIDRFNANLASQKNMIEKDKLALDKDKFQNGKNQWNAEFRQKQKDFDLAVKQYKLDKSDKTWKNVLATSKELRGWVDFAVSPIRKAAEQLRSMAASGAKSKSK